MSRGLRPFVGLLLFFAVLWTGVLLPRAALGNASLFRGGELLGTVATTSGAGGAWVSVEEVGALLGFSASRAGEELLLVQGTTRLRVVKDAAAAWRGRSLVPLHAPVIERDGRYWADTASASALFQSSVGAGAANRLRFRSDGGAPEAPPEPQRQPPAPPARNEERAPAAAPVAGIPAPQPVTLEPRQNVPVPPAPQPAAPQPAPQPVISPKTGSLGEAQRVRWGGGGHKVRAVVDLSDGAEPDVRVENGTVRAVFASAPAALEGVPGPYANVGVRVQRSGQGTELVFAADGARVEPLMLSSPRRLVLDFFFPSSVRVHTGTAPEPAPAPVPAPAPAPAPVPVQRKGRRRLVVVDPGHGGKDPGTAGNGVTEKNVNLAIGLNLERILKEKGFDVIMTRRTDVYLTLQARTDVANNAHADVFVSVHVNALPSKSKTSGFEIYIMALPTDKDALNLAKIENREYIEEKAGSAEEVDQRTERLLRILGDMQQNNKISESTGLAEVLFNAGKQGGLPMRRVAQAPFFVLRGAGMPAVLLETGFVTNATEAKLLAHPGYQQRIAEVMAAGIEAYLNR